MEKIARCSKEYTRWIKTLVRFLNQVVAVEVDVWAEIGGDHHHHHHHHHHGGCLGGWKVAELGQAPAAGQESNYSLMDLTATTAPAASATNVCLFHQINRDQASTACVCKPPTIRRTGTNSST